jgi:hypothetical protein
LGTYLVEWKTTAVGTLGRYAVVWWMIRGNGRAPLYAPPISRESFGVLPAMSIACRKAVGHTQIVKLRCSRQLADICMEMVVVR